MAGPDLALLTSSNDDRVDRLNHIVMTLLYLVMACVCGLQHLHGKPINCWVPFEYKDEYNADYVNDFCWSNGLYLDTQRPEVEGSQEKVVFHQWAFFVLISQAFFFKVPHLIWSLFFFKSSGVNLDKIIELLWETENVPSFEERHEKLEHIARYFDKWIKKRSPASHDRDGANLREQPVVSNISSGLDIVRFYIFTKTLYVVNTFVQISVLANFLNIDLTNWRFSAISLFTSGTTFEDNFTFPRVSNCDLEPRHYLANSNTITVQCTLPINLFLEAIFYISWICILLVGIINCFSFVLWMSGYMTDDLFTTFLDNHEMPVYSEYINTHRNPKMSRVTKFLHLDGVFVLHMASRNMDLALTADLIRHVVARFDKDLREKMNAKLENEKKTDSEADGLRKRR